LQFVDDADLWLATGDKTKRLTHDGSNNIEQEPSFVGANALLYSADVDHYKNTALYELCLDDLSKHTVLEAPEFHASPWALRKDGTLVGLMSEKDAAEVRLIRFDPTDSKWRELHRFELGDGSELTDYDQSRLQWSPNEKELLVTLTFLQYGPSGKTMFVLDSTGADLIAPRFGTGGIWSADGRSVLYTKLPADQNVYGNPGAWFQVDVRTGNETRLKIRRGAIRASLSPDGTKIAYDDAKGSPSVYVYDLASGVERRLSGSLVAPVWLNDSQLVATGTRPCRDDECVGSDWHPSGVTWLIEVASGNRIKQFWHSTLGASILRK